MTTLVHGFSKITDGNMSYVWGQEEEVTSSRKAYIHHFGFTPEQTVFMDVTRHSADIHVASSSDRGRGALSNKTALQLDALITSETELPLMLLTADCYPVILHDPDDGVLGLVHAGWKGVHQRLIQKVIQRMSDEFGAKSERIEVVLGPGIRPSSYVMQDVQQWEHPEWRPYLHKREDGMTEIDLPGYLVAQCYEAGVKASNITDTKIDTATNADYFSHYRAVRNGEAEGRFLTIAIMK